MTTIVYRDGVIAADTMLSCGDSLKYGITKIARGPDGRLGGGCGDAAFTTPWLRWLRGDIDQMPEPKFDDKGGDTGFVVWPDGKIEVFERGGSFMVEWPYFAIGSGSPEAMGALFVGASAEEAVRAAIQHDAHTGGAVQVLSR
jgi:ATP-dependent HslUV protease subunit HslV